MLADMNAAVKKASVPSVKRLTKRDIELELLAKKRGQVSIVIELTIQNDRPRSQVLGQPPDLFLNRPRIHPVENIGKIQKVELARI